MNQDTGKGKRLTFPRQYRLTKTDEFSSVFGFRKAIRGQSLILHYGSMEGDFLTARLGLVVGKRLMKRAVDRNRVKRVARERFRLIRDQLPRLDIVIRLMTKLSKPDPRLLAVELSGLFAKLQKKLPSPDPSRNS